MGRRLVRLTGAGAPAVAAAVIAASAVLAVATRDGPRGRAPTPAAASPAPAAASPATTLAPLPGAPRTGEPYASRGVATTVAPADVLRAPAAARVSRLRAGVPLPIVERRGDHVRVQTPCLVDGWVATRDVEIRGPHAAARDMRSATLVLDAGHGGRQRGALGPTGLAEADVNMDIVRRLAAMLGSSRVVLTRSAVDVEAGLPYRTALANALAADALLSVHNNSEADGPSARPGTEIYHQAASARSRRLAGLAYEEVSGALEAFGPLAWASERDAGAKPRTNASGGDWYGILRRSTVPAVIVEAAFISNAPEESLLRRDDVRQSIAEALRRALVRYVTTDDPGSGFVEPYPRRGGTIGTLPGGCVDPA